MVDSPPIELVAPDETWPRQFEERADLLHEALGDVALRIEHVGSTAVPGLWAKPTIDLQVSVDDLDRLEVFRDAIERVGYVFHERSLSEPGHRFFSAAGRAAHVHVCEAGSAWERRHLLFRDYLRANAGAAREYERVKLELVPRFRHDREEYNLAKTEVISRLMEDAERWATDGS